MSMNYRFARFIRHTLMIVSVAVVCVEFSACSDDYNLDDGNYPSWLGKSVYDALKSPESSGLYGTFSNYLRLVDDLGYAETLKQTGSKTVFPANDAAFEKFFADNSWDVKRYEDLSTNQKRMLLYNSMLDNALTVSMLSNTTSSYSDKGSGVTRGMLMQHTTSANVIDTITHIFGPSGMPHNNPYWSRFYNKGIDLVMDATRPRMVHFTAEHMLNHLITTGGTNSDFQVITGSPYTEGESFIFRNKIIAPNVTCKNGYIHQIEGLIVPPGNMAQVINENGNTKIISRMLERFCAPYYDAVTTNNYNDWALANGKTVIDSIFQKRYFSNFSSGLKALDTDPSGKHVETGATLAFDPGWNGYKASITATDLSDVGTMFVPTDKAMKSYFLPGGSGAFLIKRYGKNSNTEANLMDNIDDIPLSIVATMLNNMMSSSFASTVPSKFGNIFDTSGEPMGLDLSSLNTSDGKYDIKIANNGVIYMLNKMFAPPEYIAVYAPALFGENMKMINWLIQDGSDGKGCLGLNYYAYLLAMKANYALFLPDDNAFANYYVDPVSLKNSQPRALKFYFDSKENMPKCISYKYDTKTGEVGEKIEDITVYTVDKDGKTVNANISSQLRDIIYYNTVVLGAGETLGSNRFYKTKHGGEIEYNGNNVKSGAQINDGMPESKIKEIYKQANGTSYEISHVIQGPIQSVYNVLSKHKQFSEFMDLCNYENIETVLTFAGISNTKSDAGVSPQDKYNIFVSGGYDYRVKVFNSYNYTVYAPDNAAMEIAYAKGLPKWSEAFAIATKGNPTDEDKKTVYNMVEEIHRFILYHFQDNSIYSDKTIDGGRYQTSCINDNNIYQRLTVGGSNGEMTVKDNSGREVIVKSSDDSKLVNVMARDFVFTVDKDRNNQATAISASSFAVIHEIATPLCYHSNFNYSVK